jgi:TetR/AcrR family transcriptional regulator, ethionamide resistance regulator
MAATAQKKKADRARRRAGMCRRLLAALAELTAEGEIYSNLSIERLATAAGLSRATFYIYFDGKGDLLREGFREVLKELQDASAAWLDIGAATTRQDVDVALERIIGTYRRGSTLLAAVKDEATLDSSLRAQVDEVIHSAIATLRSQIERGQEEGWIDPALMPLETASWLVWMLERGLSHLVPAASDEQVLVLTRTLSRMVRQTLFVGASARE